MDEPFVINVAEAEAYGHPLAGSTVIFEDPDEPFPELGINVRCLRPGQANGRYHRESVQEDFLVLGGHCTLLLDDREIALEPWDFVHCPAGAEHIFVGAGEGPCWILMAGARREGSTIHYPVNETAARHGASTSQATDDSKVAYSDREGEIGPVTMPWPPG